MKVLHVPYSFLPDPPGGTEIYVESLCRALRDESIDSVVAAPGETDTHYDIDGQRVWRFACTRDGASLDSLYGGGDPVATAGFGRVLDAVQPDVVHQHALSPACSVALVDLAKRRDIPVVFTYHTPTVSCQRGTLLRMGSEECAGAVEIDMCTECVLDDLGVNPLIRRVVEAVPVDVGRSLGRRGLSGGVWTALRMRALMEGRVAKVRQLWAQVDCFVAPSPWVVHLLQGNGVPAERIRLSLHGIDASPVRPSPAPAEAPREIRLAHLGRLDPAKGTAVLLRAMASEPAAPVALDIFGIVQHGASAALSDALRAMASGDPRIRFLPPMAHRDVVPTLSRYDAVVVPSQWMETGPLVVLEAFAAGVPVIGSALGGIHDKINHEVNGLLVSPFFLESAWAQTLLRCASDRDLLPRLRAGVVPPRAMGEVAREMASIYAGVRARVAAPSGR